MVDIDIGGVPSPHANKRLSRCADLPTFTGHVELIELADRLVTALLNEDESCFHLAEQYRSLRIQAVTQAGQVDSDARRALDLPRIRGRGTS